jgi:hypothetical protein
MQWHNFILFILRKFQLSLFMQATGLSLPQRLSIVQCLFIRVRHFTKIFSRLINVNSFGMMSTVLQLFFGETYYQQNMIQHSIAWVYLLHDNVVLVFSREYIREFGEHNATGNEKCLINNSFLTQSSNYNLHSLSIPVPRSCSTATLIYNIFAPQDHANRVNLSSSLGNFMWNSFSIATSGNFGVV